MSKPCKCCYCEAKGKTDNPEYIRGIRFATEFVRDEYEELQRGVERWRKQSRNGTINARTLKMRVEYLEGQMRLLGKWHDVLAKEGNKEIKLIKDIDWSEYLYGEQDEHTS